MTRRVVLCVISAALLELWAGSVCARAEAPALAPERVWELDLDDSAEASRWQLLDEPLNPGTIRCRHEYASLDGKTASGTLVFEAAPGIGAASLTTVYRPFPPDFFLTPNSSFVLEWSWELADTRLSDGVAIGLVMQSDRDGSFERSPVAISHTRYTIAWRVLFDAAETWYSHRIGLGQERFAPSYAKAQRPIGIFFAFQDPVAQRLRVSRLRLEAWPAGAVETDPVLDPHRLTYDERPFTPSIPSTTTAATTLAAEDLDGDGLPELLLAQHHDFVHVWRNDGHGAFVDDITEPAGLVRRMIATGALFIDIDRDGDRDLVLSGEFDVPILFENRGGLHFEPVTLESDRALGFWYGCAGSDYDLDGNIDLACTTAFGAPGTTLLQQAGPKQWRSIVPSGWAGVSTATTSGFAAAWGDLDGDHYPELAFGRTSVAHNRAGVLQAPEMLPTPVTSPEEVEGQVFADFNADGTLDLAVLRDMPRNTGQVLMLFNGDGQGGLQESPTSHEALDLSEAEVLLAEDFDNDGRLDLYICREHLPNVLLLQTAADDWRDASELSGLADQGGCAGAIAADFDGDGRLDVAIASYGESPRLLRNHLANGHWIGVSVFDRAGADAVGTRIDLIDTATGKRLMTRWLERGQGFGSNGPAERRFGLGTRTSALIRATYPSGAIRERTISRVDQSVTLSEPSDGPFAHGWSRLREIRSDITREFRRSALAQPMAGVAIVTVGLVAGFLIVSWRPMRWFWLSLSALMVALSSMLGSVPGRGLGGWAAGLWVSGQLLGAVIPSLATIVVRGGRRLSRAGARSGSREELMRRSIDFRHSGSEARALIAMTARLQNLFIDGRLHEQFVIQLRELAAAHRRMSIARLSQLISLSELVLDSAEEPGQLKRSSRQVAALLAELDSERPRTDEQWGRWRAELLPLLDTHRENVAALLAAIDRQASLPILEVHDLVEAACKERQALIPIEFEPGARHYDRAVQVVISPTALTTVLEVLLDNALEAARPDQRGAILVSLTVLPRDVELSVEDDGVGMAPGTEAEVFKFGVSSRPAGGGYGLPRSRELLAHYGGRLELRPAAQLRGARFIVMLRRSLIGPTGVRST